MIQLPKISKELEEEYLADVQKSYKELLEKLKKSRNGVKKKKTKTEDDKQKREEEYLSEVKAIVDFLSTEGKLDDDKIKNILVGRVASLEKAMTTIGPIKSKQIQKEFERVYKDAAKRIQNTWDLLKLGPLYEKHSDYIRNILRAKQIYTEEYLDQLMKSFPGAFDDMDDLKNVVYFNYLDEEDWGKRILAKLTHDLEVENS